MKTDKEVYMQKIWIENHMLGNRLRDRSVRRLKIILKWVVIVRNRLNQLGTGLFYTF